MAYSVLSNALVCLDANCGFEIEMDNDEAQELLAQAEDLVCMA
jgi:hypothetical protein